MDVSAKDNLPSDWRFDGADLSNTSTGLVPGDNPMSVCREDLIGPSCSSATHWEHATFSQNRGYCDINVQINTNQSNTMGNRKAGPAIFRGDVDGTIDMDWDQQSSMSRRGAFLPNVPGMLPQIMPQFPADSAFIERAARFTCFKGGNFSYTVNSFGFPNSMGVYGEGSLLKNERTTESLVRSFDEVKQGVAGSGNESNEAEFSGEGGQAEPMLEGAAEEASAKGISERMRKRSWQVETMFETAKDNTEIEHKGDQNPTLTSCETAGKNGKQGSQASDQPKEEYIHVRARRGQATNSHSLAERVRREKISERMKFLQDLVPGCTKVTGKAVMLDEIINYVQSLQRQVEFLSMKLAMVNPRLDFNVEGLLAKNQILQSPPGSSSTLGCPLDMQMSYPPLYPSQPGLIQSALHGVGSPSDMLRRAINSQSTSMTGQKLLPDVWDDELHNVVWMGLAASAPSDSQDVNAFAGDLSSSSHMKVEL